MFISGFVFMYTNHDKIGFGFVNFIKKKILRLLVPSFLVLTVAFLLRAVLSYSKGTGADFYSITNYFKMFFLKHYLPIEFLWYIFALFDIFLLSALLLYCIRKKYIIILLSFVFLAMNLFPVAIDIFYIKYMASYLIYFWFGSIYCLVASERRLLQQLHKYPAKSFSVVFRLNVNRRDKKILENFWPGT